MEITLVVVSIVLLSCGQMVVSNPEFIVEVLAETGFCASGIKDSVKTARYQCLRDSCPPEVKAIEENCTQKIFPGLEGAALVNKKCQDCAAEREFKLCLMMNMPDDDDSSGPEQGMMPREKKTVHEYIIGSMTKCFLQNPI
ncbi:uncharacterized protein LOC106462078 [Limulus polyphemus]|uniref:Uncharacterized protein LOC106462078 n=1 Tax=Limulus polyphemus TaxID=6850 RepID=A0ABM1B998_LIMPO|nr:uncharacterized protein LOC106462078 [Limulus polyphemus]